MTSKIWNKRTLFFFLGLSIFVLCFFSYIVYENESNKMKQAINNGMYFSFVSNEPETVEYGSDIEPRDFVKDYKGHLTYSFLDTRKVGSQTIEYTLDYGGYKSKYYKKVTIQDTQKPVLNALNSTDFVININDPIPYKSSDFEAYDVIDGDLDIKFNGEVNTHQKGIYYIQVSCQDFNKNITRKTLKIIVTGEEKNNQFSYSIGDQLDNFSRIDDTTFIVRNKKVYISENLDLKYLEFYIKQFNLCPEFLLDCVDEFYILDDDNFKKIISTDYKENSKILGLYKKEEGKSVIYLRQQEQNEDVLLHETAHSFSKKYSIASSKEFTEIFKEESDDFNSYASKNSEEFFAYTYAEYLLNGYDSLFDKCPKTAQFYKEMQL